MYIWFMPLSYVTAVTRVLPLIVFRFFSCGSEFPLAPRETPKRKTNTSPAEKIRPSNIPLIAMEGTIIRRARRREVSARRATFSSVSRARPNILALSVDSVKGAAFFPRHPSMLTSFGKSPEIRGLTFYRTTGLYCSDCGSTKREGIKFTAAAPEETSPEIKRLACFPRFLPIRPRERARARRSPTDRKEDFQSSRYCLNV